MSSINFFTEDIEFELSDSELYAQWIEETITKWSKELVEINYIFCSDTYLHQVNVEYLDHDTFTDIITFDNAEEDDQIESDIFISIDRVKENASSLSIPFKQELRRVMIHGVLHLLGLKDKTDEEANLMRQSEDECLAFFPSV